MQFFRDTKIDFMRYRRIGASVSAVLLAVALALVVTGDGLNFGIDFVGGTQLTVKFSTPPQIDQLRDLMNASGIEDVSIQRFGDLVDNEAIIKTPLAEGSEEGSRVQIVDAIRGLYGTGSGRLDVNEQGVQALASFLTELDPDQLRALDEAQASRHYRDVAAAVGEVKREIGLLTSWDQLSGVAELSLEAAEALRQNADLGSFTVVGAENVGPQIGSELRQRGLMAVILALFGMLLYIWLRFELRYGIGALVAVTHDVFVCLGLFALAGLEFNVTTIAGFLTLVGYSVNDTVVVFDRVRENLRQNRRGSLLEIMNQSLNQTLSRTVLTSGTTLLVVGCLLFLGGDVLRGFAFILTVGVIVGTYSSIYIASPFALLWEHWFGAEARSKRRSK
ncbi:MAG: protein translocase subunit SecF [Acidobacteria bacterium]|nr:protein translocase subunit SecF [Acidobacteriota bacterium]